jgi:hypothetical protein
MLYRSINPDLSLARRYCNAYLVTEHRVVGHPDISLPGTGSVRIVGHAFIVRFARYQEARIHSIDCQFRTPLWGREI